VSADVHCCCWGNHLSGGGVCPVNSPLHCCSALESAQTLHTCINQIHFADKSCFTPKIIFGLILAFGKMFSGSY